MQVLSFAPPPPCPEAETLRGEVRELLARELAGRSAEARAVSWSGFDP